MKIRLSDISAAGLKIDDTIPLEPLNARLKEGRDCGIIFLEAPRVTIAVNKTANGAETKGSIRSKYRQPCALCNEEVEKEIEVEANFVLKPRPEDVDDTDPQYMDDVGIVFYEGEHIDLEEVVQETLILGLSLYWHPPQDEKGDCERCGVNFVKEIAPKSEKGGKKSGGTSLRQLLSEAGVATNGAAKRKK